MITQIRARLQFGSSRAHFGQLISQFMDKTVRLLVYSISFVTRTDEFGMMIRKPHALIVN